MIPVISDLQSRLSLSLTDLEVINMVGTLIEHHFSPADYNGPNAQHFIERIRCVMLAKDEFLDGNPNFNTSQLKHINQIALELFEQVCYRLKIECEIYPNPHYYSDSEAQAKILQAIKQAVDLIQDFSLKIMRLCDENTQIDVLAKQFYDAEARALFRESQIDFYHTYSLDFDDKTLRRFSKACAMSEHTKPSTARGILMLPGSDAVPKAVAISNFRRQYLGGITPGENGTLKPLPPEFVAYRHSSFPTIEMAGDDSISRYRRMQGALMSVREWLEGIARDHILEQKAAPSELVHLNIASLALLSPSFLRRGKECEETQLRESFDALMMCDRQTFELEVNGERFIVVPRITFMNAPSNDLYLQPLRYSKIEEVVDSIGMCHFTYNTLLILKEKIVALAVNGSALEDVVTGYINDFVEAFMTAFIPTAEWKTFEEQYPRLLKVYALNRKMLDSQGGAIDERAARYCQRDLEVITLVRANFGQYAAEVIGKQRHAWLDSLQILAASVLDQLEHHASSAMLSDDLQSLRDIVILFINACDFYYLDRRETSAHIFEFQPRFLLSNYLCGLKVDTFCKSGEDRTGFVLSECERLLIERQLSGGFPALALGRSLPSSYHTDPERVAIRRAINAYSVNSAVANSNAPGAHGLQFALTIPAVEALCPKVSTKLAKIARKPYDVLVLQKLEREQTIPHTLHILHKQRYSQQILAPSLRAYCLELAVKHSEAAKKMFHYYQPVDIYDEDTNSLLLPTQLHTLTRFNIESFSSMEEMNRFLQSQCQLELKSIGLLREIFREHSVIIEQFGRVQNQTLLRMMIEMPWRFDLSQFTYECVNQLNYAHDAFPINPDDKKHLINILIQAGICSAFSSAEIAALCHEQRTIILRRIIDNLDIRDMVSHYPVNPNTSTEKLITCFQSLNVVSMRHPKLPKQFLDPNFLVLQNEDRERLQADWTALHQAFKKVVERHKGVKELFPRSRVIQHFFDKENTLVIDDTLPACMQWIESVSRSESVIGLSLQQFSGRLNAFVRHADGSAFNFLSDVSDAQNIYNNFIREARFRVFSEDVDTATDELNHLDTLLHMADSSIESDLTQHEKIFLKTPLPSDTKKTTEYFDSVIAQLLYFLEQQPAHGESEHPQLKKVNNQIKKLQTWFGVDGESSSSLLDNIIEPSFTFVTFSHLSSRYANLLKTRQAYFTRLDNHAGPFHAKMETFLANIIDSLLSSKESHLALGRVGLYGKEDEAKGSLDLLSSGRTAVLVIKMLTVIFENHERFQLNHTMLTQLLRLAQLSREQILEVKKHGMKLQQRRIAENRNTAETNALFKSNIQILESAVEDPEFNALYEAIRCVVNPELKISDESRSILVYDPQRPIPEDSLRNNPSFKMFSSPHRVVTPLAQVKPDEAISQLQEELKLKECNVAFSATTDKDNQTRMAFWRVGHRQYNEADAIERRVILKHLEKRITSTPRNRILSHAIVFSGRSRAMLLDFIALCDLIGVKYTLNADFEFNASEILARQKVYLTDNPDLIASLQDYVGRRYSREPLQRQEMDAPDNAINSIVVTAPVA